MANRFLDVKYDKFASKTVTSMKDVYEVKAHALKFTAMLRHVSMPDLDTLVLDLNYDGYDWFFLRNGNLTININDVENIVLEPHESYADTYTGYETCHCVESDFYELNQELLKKICDAKTLDFKISGATTYDIANGQRFIKYAQKFYNGFYDEEAYKEVVAEPAPKPKPTATESTTLQSSSPTSSSGCMVTLLMAISALSSIAFCVSFIIGLL
jgi:hypothetical protein